MVIFVPRNTNKKCLKFFFTNWCTIG